MRKQHCSIVVVVTKERERTREGWMDDIGTLLSGRVTGRGLRDGIGVSSAMVQCRHCQGEGEREKVRKKVRARVVLSSR